MLPCTLEEAMPPSCSVPNHQTINLTQSTNRFDRGAVIETDAVTRKAFGSRRVSFSGVGLQLTGSGVRLLERFMNVDRRDDSKAAAELRLVFVL